MSLKSIVLLVPIAVGGWYMAGGPGAALSREVDRPPEAVAAAIADLDIRRQPGAPGSDPAAAGGVAAGLPPRADRRRHGLHRL